jgi:hypothetical protein
VFNPAPNSLPSVLLNTLPPDLLIASMIDIFYRLLSF